MGRVCNEAWRELQTITYYPSPKDSDEMLRQMIVRVMAAVAAGEHDPARLKVVALNGVRGLKAG